MTKETKIRILTTILNAGIKGADREMLDNLKAVIKNIENTNVSLPSREDLIKTVEENLASCGVKEEGTIIPKRKAGRPFKKR